MSVPASKTPHAERVEMERAVGPGVQGSPAASSAPPPSGEHARSHEEEGVSKGTASPPISGPPGPPISAPPGASSSRPPGPPSSRSRGHVFANQHWVLEVSSERNLLVVRRTDAPFVAIPDVARSFTELLGILANFPRKTFSMLVDLRLAPRRNDPEYEQAASREPGALSRDYRRAAVIVKSASGMLHVKRHLRTHGVQMEVFIDEEQAIRYLVGG